METEPTQNASTHSFTITVPQFLVHWYQKLPKSTWRAAALLFAFGIGVGGGAFAVKESVQWYRNRPLPKLPDRKWPEFSFPEFGLRAKLSTEWDESSDHLNYRIALMPSDITNSDDFFKRLSESRWPSHVTLNVYDNRHFIIQSSDEYLNGFAAIIEANGKKRAVISQGKLFLTRDQYAALSSWDLTVSGLPSINQGTTSGTTETTATSSDKSTLTSGAHKVAPQHGEPTAVSTINGNDVITGYSAVGSNLSTSGGLTFHIYKDAETYKAIEWGVESPHVHYECSPTLECTLHENNSDIILHAQLRK